MENIKNTESTQTSLNREYITTVTDKLREIIADGKVTNEELDKVDESFTELGIYDNALREVAKSYNSENSGAFASFGMLKEYMIKGFEKMQKFNVGTGGPSTNEIHLAFENANSIEEARENLRKLKNKNVTPETANKNVSPETVDNKQQPKVEEQTYKQEQQPKVEEQTYKQEQQPIKMEDYTGSSSVTPKSVNKNVSPETANNNVSPETANNNVSPETVNKNVSPETVNKNVSPEK
jgi:hypothetical protein